MYAKILAALLMSLCLFPSLSSAQAPNLNMIAVGINIYRQPGMNLNYSVADAQDIAGAMNANRTFARKDINVLTNQQATVQNIMNAVNLLERRANPNTYSILYLSGHGMVNGAGHFLYPSFDYDPRNADGTSIAGEVLLPRLKRMPGRVFLIIDACHSGGAGFTSTGWVRSDPTNQTVIISSSLSREFSLELGQFRNGAFTRAFLEGLNGAADGNRNGTITLQEMHNYVYTRVGQITNGKQHIITFVPSVAHGNMALVASQPPTQPASSSSLWQGRENLQGFGPLSFGFAGNGQVTMTDAQGTSAGTWTRQGDTITLRFANGRVIYQGRLVGNTIAGTARNASTTWSFSVARR